MGDWRLFSWVIFSQIGLVVFLPIVLPESCRWLIAKGKAERAVKILKKMAKMNKKEVDMLNQNFNFNIYNYNRYLISSMMILFRWQMKKKIKRIQGDSYIFHIHSLSKIQIFSVIPTPIWTYSKMQKCEE